MNRKVCDNLFFYISLLLIFINAPNIIRLNSLGSNIGDKLILYPLISILIYVGYCQYKYKNILIELKKLKYFFGIYILIMAISLIEGLYTYPYYEQILNGPINQIEKLPRVFAVLQSWNINIEEKTLVIFWMIIRFFKSLFLEMIYTFGGAYIIYCCYYNCWERGLNIIFKAIACSVIIICLYSFIEVFYLGHNEWATNILMCINPYIHIIEQDGTWWPPLLWKNQLRSVFAEPSYLGIYAAFGMPFLWYKIVTALKYKKIYIFLTILFTFFLFLTQARTVMALFSGELIILVISSIWLKNKLLLKKIIIILFFSMISFISANIFITNIMMNSEKITINNSVEIYIENNLGSLASVEQRSNTARYSVMIADLKIGLSNPILGVGTGLRNAYIPEYLPEMSEGNKEIDKWIIDQKEKGILKAGFPKLGEYTSRFAETGILGLAAFLVPPIFLLINLLKKIKKEKDLRYVAFTISFIGIMAAGIGDSINITYCYWVLLGLGYAMCFGKPGDEIKHE